MKQKLDFSKAKKNPYTKLLKKKAVQLRNIDSPIIELPRIS